MFLKDIKEALIVLFLGITENSLEMNIPIESDQLFRLANSLLCTMDTQMLLEAL